MTHLEKLEQMASVNLENHQLVMHNTHSNYWGARCILELQYAIKLSESEEHAYDELINGAIDIAWNEFTKTGAVTKQTTRNIEAELALIADEAKAYKLLCIGHAHIDMNWMWGFDETVSITIDTFRTMLDLMKEYPEFTFGQSQASVYRIVEQYCPEMLEEMKQRIHEKRWEVVASTWVEADRNMPNLESMARHLLYTKQYLSQLLDIDPETLNIDYEPDTFGHHINVPEVLCDGGVQYYYHCRGYDKHVLYRWKAPSGRSIIVYREPTWYNWTMDGRCALVVPEFCKKNGLDSMLRVYGVGDHGGGPTRRDIEKIIDMNTWPIFPAFQFGTYAEFYALAEKQMESLPVVEGELNFIFDGCYTTQTRQKKGNKISELLLAEAESTRTITNLELGYGLTDPSFSEPWKKVLFNQFHDILPGSGIIDTREYAMGQYQEVYATANTSRMKSIRALSDAIDTSGFVTDDMEDINLSRSEGAGVGYGLSKGRLQQTSRHAGLQRLFTVYNPLPYERVVLAEVSLWDWNGNPKRMKWTDSCGNTLVHQLVCNGFNDYWGHLHAEVLVQVTIPGLGYKTIAVKEGSPETITLVNNDPRVDILTPYVLENKWIRAEFDSANGGIISFIDKKTGLEYCKPGAPMGVYRLVEEDTLRGMSSWRVGRYMNIESLNHAVRIKECKIGSDFVRQSISYEKDFRNGSKLTITASLDQDESMIRFDTTVRWQEIGSQDQFYPQLQFFMPVSYSYKQARYDVPMGVIDRDLAGMDVPAQNFGMLISENHDSLMLINDSKYGYRATEEGLSLTLIRSSVDPDPWPEIGEHHIQMAIALNHHSISNAVRTAQMFCSKVVLTSARIHNGSLPADGALMKFSGTGLVLSSIKAAETGKGIIVRYYEMEGNSGQGSVEFSKMPLTVQAVNLLELPVEGLFETQNNCVVFNYRAYGVGGLHIIFD